MTTPIWIFDLDNTLHHASAAIFPHLNRQMTAYLMRHLALDETEANALRVRYWRAYGATLVYATGGLAFGSVDTTIVNTAFDDVASRSDTRLGYSVGGGVDFLVNPNFSLGVEYLYTDLGSDDVSRSYDLGGGDTLNVSADRDFDFHTVWAKASFRFN